MASKYDTYWQSKVGRVSSLLGEAHEEGSSSTLDVSDIQSFGDRDNWYGIVEVSKHGLDKGEMAHARSLGNVILDQGLLEHYEASAFRLVISLKLGLRVERLDTGDTPLHIPTRLVESNHGVFKDVHANLVTEFERIQDHHRTAIRMAAARTILGASVIRVFEKGTKQRLLPLLVDIPVDGITNLSDKFEFKAWFEEQLDLVAKEIRIANPNNSRIHPGYKWGHSAKVLNLFICQVVLGSRYFSDSEVCHIRPWLYIPIDGIVIERLRKMGLRLPFTKIKEIDSPEDFHLVQDQLERAAIEVGVPRIWFDDVWGDRQ